MVDYGRAVQSLVVFSAVLGVPFLLEVNGLLPAAAFDFVFAGWVLFVVDAFLTFLRPVPAYALAFVLAILALASSLPQSAHYGLIESGELLQAATFVLGSAAQVLLLVLVPLYFLGRRRPLRAAP